MESSVFMIAQTKQRIFFFKLEDILLSRRDQKSYGMGLTSASVQGWRKKQIVIGRGSLEDLG